MQQFDDSKGIRRRVKISNMNKEDAEDFLSKFCTISEEERKIETKKLQKQIEKIQKKDCKKWILSIHSEDGKMIGKIEVTSSEEDVAYFNIQIPNESLIFKYGIEAIDQFLKICKENSYFREIRISPSPITEKYKNMHKMSNYVVRVA